jgi:hypothetical protein
VSGPDADGREGAAAASAEVMHNPAAPQGPMPGAPAQGAAASGAPTPDVAAVVAAGGADGA